MTAVEYQGTHVTVTARAAGDQDVTVLIPDADFYREPNNPGDRVGLTWAQENLHRLQS